MFDNAPPLFEMIDTAMGKVKPFAIVKARRKKANDLARVGMRVQGFAQSDDVAWGVFYRAVSEYLAASGYFIEAAGQQSKRQSAGINKVYEGAAQEVNFKKNLF